MYRENVNKYGIYFFYPKQFYINKLTLYIKLFIYIVDDVVASSKLLIHNLIHNLR